MCGVHIHFITLPIHLSWQQDCHPQQASKYSNKCTSNQDIGTSVGHFFGSTLLFFWVSSIWQMLQKKLECSKKKIVFHKNNQVHPKNNTVLQRKHRVLQKINMECSRKIIRWIKKKHKGNLFKNDHHFLTVNLISHLLNICCP